ncbi:MAG: hypothetical protein IK008_01870 [Bacteroidales bacterium]|nr:hypothetical protein [Bacteroidales bacterium]
MIGYNNRWLRLVKDILFVAVGVWLMTLPRFLARFVGALAIFWYGRDAYFQIKALWQEKHYKEPPKTTAQRPTMEKADRITLSPDAKEVDFKKE